MTLGSLFDGIGSWMFIAERLGIKPLWSSEIEAFPMKVSKAHFPDVKQLGDIRYINGTEVEPVDIITFSSPCQNLSVAGNRVGLHGKESSLFHEAIRIIREMRGATNGEYPKFIVWENVKNAFGTNQGNDFRTVLEEISETDIPIPRSGRWASAGLVRSKNCDISWRLFDARGWGVPQRRKRIFLIADFRSNNVGRGRFAEVLFKSKSVPWNTSESRSEECNPSDCTKESARNTIYDMTHASEAMRCVGDDCVQTLTARMGTGGNQVPVVHSYCIAGNTIDRKLKNGSNGKGINDEESYTLNTVDRHAVCIGNGQLHQVSVRDCVGALNCMHDQQAIIDCGVVRRLTPSECERLQGLPTGYTEYGSDSARYKAIGNGIAIPCATYVLDGVKEAIEGGDYLKT